MNINKKIKLNDGNEIPQLGLGVYQSKPGEETKQAVLWALEAGYRHIDSAQYYQNEKSVGEAIRESGIDREEIFVTTKIANDNFGFQKTKDAYKRSLDNLGYDYYDLLLLHWPVAEKRNESWQALVELKDEKLVKSIGVSNYTIKHLNELFEFSDTKPVVNQVEFHPFLFQQELLEHCNENSIVLEAYSPLTQGKRLDDPTLASIGNKHNKSVAQVMIRWNIQLGVVTIPKSVNQNRIKENADVFDFELSEDEMSKIASLNENLHFAWNPYEVE